MTMPRVCVFYTRDGRERYNTTRCVIPFKLMTKPGDWCEVERGPKCLGGNVASLCSEYGKKLGQKFQFKDLKNGFFRITTMAKPIRRITWDML